MAEVLSRAKALCRYLLFAKSAYGIHSPFVYQLYQEVIHTSMPEETFSSIEKMRTAFLYDNSKVEVLDLGAKAGQRQGGVYKHSTIAGIARRTSIPKPVGELLFRLIAFLAPQNIIELGTSLGISTLYLAKAAPEAVVESFEGCPKIAQIAQESLQSVGVQNVLVHIGNIEEKLPQVLENHAHIDFAFIDANHQYRPTLQYFEMFLPKIHEESCLVFDDIYWSAQMQQAWKHISEHPSVTLSIDLYRIGIVFFRKKQPKQHFTLRFNPF